MASTRRLAAIMFTDTVGYTASTQIDEGRTLDLLRQQAELVRPLVTVHQGREIKSTGDGFLIEFDSALKAAQCALNIQRRIHERNAEGGLAPIRIRIGIHLGDVVQSAGDIIGDAVNIAARIEPLAEPGGICVSGAVHEQIRTKIPDQLEKLPPTALKGLQIPIDIYRIVLPWSVREAPIPGSALAGLAVIPFANISPDSKDEYFADGLTEEIITVLSQLRDLRVIARTSVMPYKATSKGVSQIAAELRVSSILEGSVRKSGNRLRVTVQLIDVGSEGHIWANTYDRDLDDVFAVQAELAKQVAEGLKINLQATEANRLEARPTVRPDSYLAYLKGRTLLHGTSKASHQAAREQFELAISLDPGNAGAHSGLADATRLLGWWHPDVPLAKWLDSSHRSAIRAIELDPNLAEGHVSLALELWDDSEYTEAEKELRLALSLRPSYSPAHFYYACVLEDEARAEEALQELLLAEALDPLWPLLLYYLGWTLIMLGRLDEALVKVQCLGDVEPGGQLYHGILGRYYLARGDLKKCLAELNRWRELEENPRARAIARAVCCALSGEREEAMALLRKEETLPGTFSTVDDWAEIWAYSELGDVDGCFRAIDRRMKYSPLIFQQIRLDPRFELLRSDPRFTALLKKMNLA